MVMPHLELGTEISDELDGSLILSLSSNPNNKNSSSWVLIGIGGKYFCFSFGISSNEDLEVEAWSFLTPVTKEILEDLSVECGNNLKKIILKKSKQETSCKMITAHLEPGTNASVDPEGSLTLLLSSDKERKDPSSWVLIGIGGKYFCISFWINRKDLKVGAGAFLNPVTKENLMGLITECKKMLQE